MLPNRFAGNTVPHLAAPFVLPLKDILDTLDLVVFSTNGFEGIDDSQQELNDAVVLQLASTDSFRAKEQRKENEGLIGDLEAKNGKHCFYRVIVSLPNAPDTASVVTVD